jgi:lipopolysaccharide assembly outer membrane protein LptD (OstA)
MNYSFARLCLPAVVLAMGLAQSPVSAQQSIMGVQTGDLQIHTDSTDYNINSGDFSMPHHVSATRPGMTIDGDRAHGNGKRRIVYIEGHVVVHQSAGAPMPGGRASEPSTLTTDRLTVEMGARIYTADGNVHFTQGLRTVVADHGVLHDATHDLHLTGHVSINDAEQSLSADSVDYNTRTEDVQAHNNVRINVPVQSGGGSPLGEPIPANSPNAPHPRHKR